MPRVRVLWKQRVRVGVWFELRDAQTKCVDPIPTSGLLFRDGRPKPALQAFSFPFAAERLGRTRVRVWGLAPGAGPVQIGVTKGRHFRRIRKLRGGSEPRLRRPAAPPPRRTAPGEAGLAIQPDLAPGLSVTTTQERLRHTAAATSARPT